MKAEKQWEYVILDLNGYIKAIYIKFEYNYL